MKSKDLVERLLALQIIQTNILQELTAQGPKPQAEMLTEAGTNTEETSVRTETQQLEIVDYRDHHKRWRLQDQKVHQVHSHQNRKESNRHCRTARNLSSTALSVSIMMPFLNKNTIEVQKIFRP